MRHNCQTDRQNFFFYGHQKVPRDMSLRYEFCARESLKPGFAETSSTSSKIKHNFVSKSQKIDTIINFFLNKKSILLSIFVHDGIE